MAKYAALAQLFLRVALSASFLYPGLDRFGFWGAYGEPGVFWGDWAHFSEYAHQLMFFLPAGLAEFAAIVASVAEIVLPFFLLIGFKTRWAAIASGILTLLFALSMTVALGIQAPLAYSVFTVSAASFMLATVSRYRYSIDEVIITQRKKKTSPSNATVLH